MDGAAAPTPEAEWARLRNDNAVRQARLVEQGIAIDADTIIRQTRIEHILRHLGGDEAIVACRLDTQRRIAAALDAAESQVNRIKLLAPGQNGRH